MQHGISSSTQAEPIKKYKTASDKLSSLDSKISFKSTELSASGDYFAPANSSPFSAVPLEQAKWFLPNSYHNLFSEKHYMKVSARTSNTKNLISSKIKQSKQPLNEEKVHKHAYVSTPQYPNLFFDPAKTPTIAESNNNNNNNSDCGFLSENNNIYYSNNQTPVYDGYNSTTNQIFTGGGSLNKLSGNSRNAAINSFKSVFKSTKNTVPSKNIECTPNSIINEKTKKIIKPDAAVSNNQPSSSVTNNRRISRPPLPLTPRSQNVKSLNRNNPNVSFISHGVAPFKSAFTDRKRKTITEQQRTTIFKQASSIVNNSIQKKPASKRPSQDQNKQNLFCSDSMSTQPTYIETNHFRNNPDMLQRRSSTSTIDCIPAPITPIKFPLSSSPSDEADEKYTSSEESSKRVVETFNDHLIVNSIIKNLSYLMTPHIKSIISSELCNQNYQPRFNHFSYQNSVNIQIIPKPENNIVEQSHQYLQNTLSKLAQYCDNYKSVLAPAPKVLTVVKNHLFRIRPSYNTNNQICKYPMNLILNE